MSNKIHAITVEIDKSDKKVLLEVKAVGKLTHEDYEIITPLFDDALEGMETDKVDILMDISEFDGWELRAAWDDMKIGLKHGMSYHKIAIFGHSILMEYGIKIASWFGSGEIREFNSLEDAKAWLDS